jgi:fimbrial chaperone protein
LARFFETHRFACMSGPLLFLALLTATAGAQAANFAVSPTQISLGLRTSSELTITNQSTHAVTLSVSAYAWSQGPSGKPSLTPSSDILVFPGIFTLLPLQRETLRVGVTAPPRVSERTYRVVVSELPAMQIGAETHGASIRILTAFSIPVFLSATAPQVAVDFQNPRISAARFSFEMSNGGTVHLGPSAGEISAKNASGRTIWSHPLSVWYILAGDHASVSVPLPPAVCASAQSYDVRLAAGDVRLDHAFTGVAGCRT